MAAPESGDARKKCGCMTPEAIRRGFYPKDKDDFSPQALVKLKRAQEELQWLLDRGYPMGTAINFVGGHHQLTSRQRSALQRATDRSESYLIRQQKQLPLHMLSQGTLLIDGFNVIITLETALSGSLLVLGADGVLRDLAGLRGTYRVIRQTEHAIGQIFEFLDAHQVPAVEIYLDAPVSNSGQLKRTILQCAEMWRCQAEVELVPNADAMLTGKERIVSSDSVLLDQCQSWLNLTAELVQKIPQAWVVTLQETGLKPDRL